MGKEKNAPRDDRFTEEMQLEFEEDGEELPNVKLSPEEHKIIAKFCIENDIKIGEFLRRAGIYCATNRIIPD